jgi:hypothetical protein
MKKIVVFFLILMVVTFIVYKNRELSDTYVYVSMDNNITVSKDIVKYEELKRRFSEYWEAASLNDFNTTYEYELPYLNFLKSLDWYIDFKQGSKKHYKVLTLDVKTEFGDSDIAIITMKVELNNFTRKIADKWVLVNGIWYHYYSQSLLPPPPKFVPTY